jgi:hypothetical protein
VALPGVRIKAKLIALYVSDRLGGCLPRAIRLRRNNRSYRDDDSSPLPIGALAEGLSRHRALLFKYLCAVAGVDVPCRLMRTVGVHGDEIRIWSTVAVGPSIDGMGSIWLVVPL